MSLQSNYLGAAREARDLIVHAQESRSVPPYGRLRSVLLGREATAMAAMGDAVGARRALGRARRAFERSGNYQEPDWVAFQTPAELVVCESVCRANLDDHAGAREQLYAALDLQDRKYVRNRALYTTWLAEMELANADLDRASSLAGEALVLAAEIRSTRVVEHIGRFRRAVDGHRHMPAVRDFVERCDGFLHTRLRTAG